MTKYIYYVILYAYIFHNLKKIPAYIIGIFILFSAFAIQTASEDLFVTTENLYSAPVTAKTITIKKKVKKVSQSNNNDVCKLNADTSQIPKQYQQKFMDVVNKIGCEKFESLRTIEVFDDMDMPRALAGSTILKIRKDVFEKEEFESLMIHEFGHIVDLGYLRGDASDGVSLFRDGSAPIFSNDLSAKFYKISWSSSKNTKLNSNSLDFVSGYAKTDSFEDFAETMLYYVNHNKEFRILASKNAVLKKKYDFMKNNVFAGKIFNTGNNFVDQAKREWDATKLAIKN